MDLAFRWKVLVLWADSASGKSNFAESLSERPFIVTVEGAEHLDLRGFDGEQRDGIVLATLGKELTLIFSRRCPGL